MPCTRIFKVLSAFRRKSICLKKEGTRCIIQTVYKTTFRICSGDEYRTLVRSVSDPDPHWISVRLASWIRIQKMQNRPKLKEKTKPKARKIQHKKLTYSNVPMKGYFRQRLLYKMLKFVFL
jgi:hypothetical protein